MASNNKPWYLRSVTRWQALQTIPMSRLWVLLLAAFLLFSIPGFYSDIMNHGIYPYAVAFVVAIITGLNAALWVISFARGRLFVVPVLIVLQFCLGPFINLVANGIAHTFHLQTVPSEHGIRFAATCMLFASIASYVAFVTFIRSEGKHSRTVFSEPSFPHWRFARLDSSSTESLSPARRSVAISSMRSRFPTAILLLSSPTSAATDFPPAF